MLKQSFLITLGITTLTALGAFNLGIYPTFSQSNNSQNKLNSVQFLCKEIHDKASGEKIPATVAWIPERKGHVRFIGWKSEYFIRGGWSPEKRCIKVTEQFQKLYNQRRLQYITHGIRNGYPVICAANQGEICNEDNQLFTLKLGSTPEDILQQLIYIAEGKSKDPILQNSGEQLYVSVPKFLNKAPLIGENK